MNRYIRSQVILNTNNKRFHQILQLTTESIIFASKSDAEKWLILNHRNSPDIFYTIKNNNLNMLILYRKIYNPDYHMNPEKDIIYQKICNPYSYVIPTKEFNELSEMNNKIKYFIKNLSDLSGIYIENSSYFYQTFIGSIIYFGNLQMFMYVGDISWRHHRLSDILFLASIMNHKHIVKYLLVKKLINTYNCNDILYSYTSIFLSIYNYSYIFKSLYESLYESFTPKIIFRYCYWNIKSGHVGIFKYLYKKHPNKITRKTIKKFICIAKEVNNTKFLKYFDKKVK